MVTLIVLSTVQPDCMKKKFLVYQLPGLFFAQTLFAQNDAALLAENCLYSGMRSYLPPGFCRSNQSGIRNDRHSAVHLPNGMAMQVFEDDNYRGRSETFYSSVSCLPASWRKRVSSVKIYWIHDPGNQGGDGNSGENLPHRVIGLSSIVMHNIPAWREPVYILRR